ncbi:MAG: AsmA family protein [Candidatus Omnitrophota bacterium]
MKKIALIGVIVLIGLVGVTFMYFNYVYIPKNLKPMVVKLLEENLQKKVIVDNAFYFPLKGVLFSKVEIINADQTPFLEVSSIDFGLKSIPFIKKNGFVAKLRLVVKGIVFKQNELKAQGDCAIDLDINIQAKEEIVFSAIMDLKDINVKGIKETGEISRIQGRIICSQNSFSSENVSATIGAKILNVRIAGDYDKQDINIRNFNIDYVDTNLSMKGKISDLQNPNIDFTIEGLIKLKDIPDILSGIPLPALRGDCKVTAECKGQPAALEKLNTVAKITFSNTSVDKIKIANLKVDINLKKGVLNLFPLDCDFYRGKITGDANVNIVDKGIPVKCSIDAQNIDIEPLVEDLTGQNMGQGVLNAHGGISGSAADLNMLNGTGWFKVIQGKVKMPPNFAKVAETLGVSRLADMKIEEASATFSLSDGKLQTQDLIMIAAEATISGIGYIDLEQYVDFEALFKLSQEFVQNTGGIGQLLSFASDETGAPLVKVRVYDKLSHLKYKIVPLPVKDIINSKIKGELQNIFKQEEGQSGKSEIQDQIKKGLEKIFR